MTTAIEKVAFGIQRYTHFLVPKSTALDDLEGSFVHCAVCTVFCYLFIVSHSNCFYTENNYRMLNLTQPRFFGLSETEDNNKRRVIGYRKTSCITRFRCDSTAVVDNRFDAGLVVVGKVGLFSTVWTLIMLNFALSYYS